MPLLLRQLLTYLITKNIVILSLCHTRDITITPHSTLVYVELARRCCVDVSSGCRTRKGVSLLSSTRLTALTPRGRGAIVPELHIFYSDFGIYLLRQYYVVFLQFQATFVG